MKEKFKPIAIPFSPVGIKADNSRTSITATTTLKGSAADEFEKMVDDNNLNRSLLLRQMIFYCLGKTEALDEMKRNLAMWGIENGGNKQ